MAMVMSACDILYLALWRTTHGGKAIQLIRLHFINMHERPGALKLAAKQINFGLNSAQLSVKQTRIDLNVSVYSTLSTRCCTQSN